MSELSWKATLERARKRWRHAMTPVAIQRACARWGVSPADAVGLEEAWCAGTLPIEPLQMADKEAVAELENAARGGRTRTALRALHRSRAWGIAVKDAEGWVLHPEGWMALARTVPGSDAAWWCRSRVDLPSAVDAAAAFGWERLRNPAATLADCPPGWRDALPDAPHPEADEAQPVSGDQVRGALWAQLQRPLSADPPPALRWLLDHAPQGGQPGWTVVRLGELVADGDVLRQHVARAAAGNPDSPTETRAALRALVQGADSLTVVALLERAAALAPPYTGGLRDALSIALADHASMPSWRTALGLARAPGVVDELDALTADLAWWDFDAPGEGELPRLWSRLLVLAGAWTTDRAAALRACATAAGTDPEPWWDHALPLLAEVLEPLPSPQAAGELDDLELSALSSYHHGLQDGTQEAYGDVHAPWDPFSSRATPLQEGRASHPATDPYDAPAGGFET